jgi:hypothetical protein
MNPVFMFSLPVNSSTIVSFADSLFPLLPLMPVTSKTLEILQLGFEELVTKL